jgi:DNA mismatch endonuclease (patch repair protein)
MNRTPHVIVKHRSPETISYTMSRIRGKDTSIERKLRLALWKVGLRYRKNYSGLPGKPDIVFLRAKVAVFCDSSFWHGRDPEKYLQRITSNPSYWRKKIYGNRARDERINAELKELGWRVIRFWDSDIEMGLGDCTERICTLVRPGARA